MQGISPHLDLLRARKYKHPEESETRTTAILRMNSTADGITKCDIIRAGMKAWYTGKCTSKVPSPECEVLSMATKRDIYFDILYSPSEFLTSERRASRKELARGVKNSIDISQTRLEKLYGTGTPLNIRWSDFPLCLWNPDGSPGGNFNNVYFSRNDLSGAGYAPRPLLGGKLLEGKLPQKITSKIPVWTDKIFNPDLLVVLIFAFLVLVFAAVLLSRSLSRSSKKTKPFQRTASSLLTAGPGGI